MKTRSALRAALPAALALCLAALPAAAVPHDVADVTTGITQVEWTPHHGYAGFRLVVSGPDGVVERHFDGGDRPLFSLAELSVASDGLYKWTLTATPELPNAAIAELKAEGDAPNRGLVTRPASDLPTRMSGSFRVVGGAIVPRDIAEGPAQLAPDRASGGGAAAASAPLSRATAADQVIPDDLIVQNSLCVGFDCVNGESFGFDTIRLKENNTRIKFQDTSSGSFPTADWQLTANESASGGQSKFSIEQIDPSPSIPFTIEAGAGSHALYVDDAERVGLSTSSPVVELHIVDGDTPTIRLEQDTSSGFQAQVWDVAGNETNFFVRDVTSGSRLPFRIRPGASTSSIDIANDGDVGIGTASPDASLDVERGSAGSAKLRVIDTAGDAILDAMELLNAGEVRFAMEDTSAASRRWEFRTAGPNFQFTRDDAPAADMAITQAGDVTIRGTLTTSGPTCGGATPCDGVFAPDFALPSIEENAVAMWTSGYLPAVGPTLPKAPFNVVEKTGGILHELEKAHIYIEQLHERNEALESEQQALRDELAELRAAVGKLVGPAQ